MHRAAPWKLIAFCQTPHNKTAIPALSTYQSNLFFKEIPEKILSNFHFGGRFFLENSDFPPKFKPITKR